MKTDVRVLCKDWRRITGDPLAFCSQISTKLIENDIKLPKVSFTPNIEVSIVLGGDTFIQNLNMKYRNIDRPTNVLSFPNMLGYVPDGENLETPLLLGDIIVSYETIMREAQETNKLPINHVAHMLVHGMLHLLGFTHENEMDAIEMETLESQALLSLGYKG